MSTIYGTTRDTAIDLLSVIRVSAKSTSSLVGTVGKAIDTLDSKVSDLHANVTHEAEEKRIAMVEYSMAEFDKNHATRMVKVRKEIEQDADVKAYYLKITEARKARKEKAASVAD